jgi:serine O-acetyltransferase
MAASNLSELIQKDMLRYELRKPLTLLRFIPVLLPSARSGLKFTISAVLPTLQASQSIVVYFTTCGGVGSRPNTALTFLTRTQIGEGLYIGHSGGIVIHGDTQLATIATCHKALPSVYRSEASKLAFPKSGTAYL